MRSSKKNRVRIIRTKIIPKMISILLPVFITVLLGTGFTLMLGKAFNLRFSIGTLLISLAMGSLVFAVIHSYNNRYLSIAAVAIAVVTFFVMKHYDTLHIDTGWRAFLYYVKKFVYYNLPGEYSEPVMWKESVLTFLIMYNLIVSSVTTLVITKRKLVLLPLLLYLPLFWCSIANTTITPNRHTTVIAAAGVIMLLFVFAFRRKKKSTSERSLLVLIVPVLIYVMLPGFIFSEKYYTKDDLARDILLGMRNIVTDIGGYDNFMVNVIDSALYGKADPHPITENLEYNPLTELRSSNKDLTKVGPFDPPEGIVMTVYKDYNLNYLAGVLQVEDSQAGRIEAADLSNLVRSLPSSTAMFNENLGLSEYTDPCYCLYLKVESLDTYKENTLSNAYYTLDAYAEDAEYELKDSPYSVRIEPLIPSEIAVSPYYHELYSCTVDSKTIYVDDSLNIHADGKTFFDDNAVQDGIFTYPSSVKPVKYDGLYSDTYEDAYVYGICLSVPERTKDALTMSGALPDWYLDIYYNRSEMSDCDKVRAVTEYVRNLHPYDEDTKYPPAGVDFVPWFVSSSESGICVHYATTTMVLLRMIGVPTRFVRGYYDPRSYPTTTSYVYSSQAHAWFEYYVPGYGWIMGDSTPGMERYAANYDINAVAAAYPEIEEVKFTRTKYDTVQVVNNDDNTSDDNTAADQTAVQEEAGKGSLVRDLKILLTVLLITAAVIALAKLVWFIYWRVKFSVKDPGEKIIAYYRYYDLMSRYLKKGLPKKALNVIYKVSFSHEDITDADVKEFIKAANKGLALISYRLPVHKKLLFRLISIKNRAN